MEYEYTEGVPIDYWTTAYKKGEYLEKWDYMYPSQELVGALASLNIELGSKVLDLGCGGGQDAIFMAKCGYQVSAIDISEEAITIGKQRADVANVQINWLIGDVLNIPLERESIDLITDRSCFHHIPDAKRQHYADEIYRILKPNGFFIIRGASERRYPFFPVSKSEIEKYFSHQQFHCGSFLPVFMQNNAGGLTANMGVLRKII